VNRKKDNGMQIYYKNENYRFNSEQITMESYKFVFGNGDEEFPFHLKISIDSKRGIHAEMSRHKLAYFDEINFNMIDERLTKNEILKAVLRDI